MRRRDQPSAVGRRSAPGRPTARAVGPDPDGPTVFAVAVSGDHRRPGLILAEARRSPRHAPRGDAPRESAKRAKIRVVSAPRFRSRRADRRPAPRAPCPPCWRVPGLRCATEAAAAPAEGDGAAPAATNSLTAVRVDCETKAASEKGELEPAADLGRLPTRMLPPLRVGLPGVRTRRMRPAQSDRAATAWPGRSTGSAPGLGPLGGSPSRRTNSALFDHCRALAGPRPSGPAGGAGPERVFGFDNCNCSGGARLVATMKGERVRRSFRRRQRARRAGDC